MSDKPESVVDSDEIEEEVEEEAALMFEMMRNKLVKEKRDIMKQNSDLFEENIKLRQEHINATLVLQSEHQNTISIMKQKHEEELAEVRRKAAEERAELELQINTEKAMRASLESMNAQLREENHRLNPMRLPESPSFPESMRWAPKEFNGSIAPFHGTPVALPKIDPHHQRTLDAIGKIFPDAESNFIEDLAAYEAFEEDKAKIKHLSSKHYIDQRANQWMNRFKGQVTVKDAEALASLSAPRRSASKFVDEKDLTLTFMRTEAAYAADIRQAVARSRGAPHGGQGMFHDGKEY
jgi:hypothetical protein